MNKLVLRLQWLLLIEHDLYMIYMSVRTSTVTSLLILFNTTQHNTLWLFTLLSCSTVSVLELKVLCLVRIGEAMTVWNTLNVQIHGGKMGHGGGAVWKVSIKILTHILFSFFRYISESPSGSMVTDVNPMLLELSSSAKKKKSYRLLWVTFRDLYAPSVSYSTDGFAAGNSSITCMTTCRVPGSQWPL